MKTCQQTPGWAQVAEQRQALEQKEPACPAGRWPDKEEKQAEHKQKASEDISNCKCEVERVQTTSIKNWVKTPF